MSFTATDKHLPTLLNRMLPYRVTERLKRRDILKENGAADSVINALKAALPSQIYKVSPADLAAWHVQRGPLEIATREPVSRLSLRELPSQDRRTRWEAGTRRQSDLENVQVKRRDRAQSAGNRKLNKKRSSGRIDGAFALTMAVGAAS
jgi:hypothetical protein